MDNQRISTPLLNWTYFCQGKTIEDLRQALLYTTLELETTRLQAQEELKNRDDLVSHLKDLLSKAIQQRDEAQQNCQYLFLQKLQNQHQNQADPISGTSSIDDEQNPQFNNNNKNGNLSSSDCEGSMVSSPVLDPISHSPANPSSEDSLLPENGKFLQAIMKAGPLLQTLLLAGPLPQWRHPPPPLQCFDIPPVTISYSGEVTGAGGNGSGGGGELSWAVNRKRGSCEENDSSQANKYQRVVCSNLELD